MQAEKIKDNLITKSLKKTLDSVIKLGIWFQVKKLLIR